MKRLEGDPFFCLAQGAHSAGESAAAVSSARVHLETNISYLCLE